MENTPGEKEIVWLNLFEEECRKFRQKLWKLENHEGCGRALNGGVEALAAVVMGAASDARDLREKLSADVQAA